MRNRKGNTNGVLLASLAGLLIIAALGTWLLLQDSGPRKSRTVKPTAEVSR
jgi:hypothetical protein